MLRLKTADKIKAFTRVRLPKQPTDIKAIDEDGEAVAVESSWDEGDKDSACILSERIEGSVCNRKMGIKANIFNIQHFSVHDRRRADCSFFSRAAACTAVGATIRNPSMPQRKFYSIRIAVLAVWHAGRSVLWGRRSLTRQDTGSTEANVSTASNAVRNAMRMHWSASENGGIRTAS